MRRDLVRPRREVFPQFQQPVRLLHCKVHEVVVLMGVIPFLLLRLHAEELGNRDSEHMANGYGLVVQVAHGHTGGASDDSLGVCEMRDVMRPESRKRDSIPRLSGTAPHAACSLGVVRRRRRYVPHEYGAQVAHVYAQLERGGA